MNTTPMWPWDGQLCKQVVQRKSKDREDEEQKEHHKSKGSSKDHKKREEKEQKDEKSRGLARMTLHLCTLSHQSDVQEAVYIDEIKNECSA